MRPDVQRDTGRRRGRTLFLFLLTAIIAFFAAAPVYGIIRDLGLGDAVFVLSSDVRVDGGDTAPGSNERLRGFLFPARNVDVPVIRVIDLEGRVVYTDGSPYKNGRIRLESTPRYARTDDMGFFFFSGVTEGGHTISVLDESGAVLAQAAIQIVRVDEPGAASVVRLPDGTFVFRVSVEMELLEITLTLNREEGEGAVAGIKDIDIGAAEEPEEPGITPLPPSPPPDDSEASATPSPVPGAGGYPAPSPFNFNVHDEQTNYGSGDAAGVNIFGDGKRLAPGMKGSYRFTVDNSQNGFTTRYTVDFDALDTLPEENKLPMRYKLKAGDSYLAGDDETWCRLDDLDHSSTLKPGGRVTYTLYWYWPESENDNSFARYAGYPYSLTIRVTAGG